MPVIFFGFDEVDLHNRPGLPLTAQQLAVDMIYRCLKCKLITFVPEEWLQDQGIPSIEDFADELARVDRHRKLFANSAEQRRHNLDMGIWLEPQLACTNEGEVLVRKHFSLDGSLEEGAVTNFNEEISALFCDCNVPWDKGVLIPARH
jgi:hypothetical protein